MPESNYWTRSRRVSRRRLLRTAGAAGAGIAALGVVGCGDDDDDDDDDDGGDASPAAGGVTGTAAAGEPKRGGTLTSTGSAYTETLDPHISLRDAHTMWALLGSHLVNTDGPSFTLRGALVESWEQASSTEVILHVRQGVTWHDKPSTKGRAFTAEDVAFNLQRIAGKLDPDREVLFARRSNFLHMERAEAVDESTVRVSFAQPNGAFISGMADWRNFIVPPELVETDPDFQDPGNFSGTGAFVMDRWDSTSRSARFVANESFYEGRPYLDEIREATSADPGAAFAAFVSGQIDLTMVQGAEQRQTVEERRSEATLHTWEHVGWESYRFNPGKPPFDDPRVRRAILLATNFKESLDANYGEGYYDYTGPLVSGFPGAWTSDQVRSMPGWNPDTKDEDIKEALRLMEEAGHPGGEMSFAVLPFFLQIHPWYKNAIRLKDQLERVFPAMKVEIDPNTDGAGFSRRQANGEFDIVSYAAFPASDVSLEAALHYRTGGGRNYAKYSNPNVDKLIDDSIAELDQDRRVDILDQLQKLLLDEVYIIPIGKERPVAGTQPRVQGFAGHSGPGSFGAYDLRLFARYLWINE